MKTLYISDLVKQTGRSKEEVYNLMRRKGFVNKFGISMNEMPKGRSNGSSAIILTQEQFDYFLAEFEANPKFRADDQNELADDQVYVADLCPNGLLEINGEKQRRFKIGYTSKPITKRESDFKVTNPEAEILFSVKLNSAEEKVLLKYIDGKGCSRIGSSEVFNVIDVDHFLREIKKFAEELQ